jgi:hypothetical protein
MTKKKYDLGGGLELTIDPERVGYYKDGWRAILHDSFGMKASKCYRTKAEAQRDAAAWRMHIASLRRKPRGVICVITEKKFNAMNYSCAITPWTTPEQDARIVRQAKREMLKAAGRPFRGIKEQKDQGA